MLIRPLPSYLLALSAFILLLILYSSVTLRVRFSEPNFGVWQDGRLSFRQVVEASTRLDPLRGKFDKVVVINLDKRQDRRTHMATLARLHDIDLEFFNATSYTSPEVVWVQERILEDTSGIEWDGSRTSTEDPFDSWENYYASLPLSPRPAFPSIYPSSNLTGLAFPLVTSGVTSIPGPIACYISHLHALQHIIQSNASRTLILEDDVDLAWDIQPAWTSLIHALEFSLTSTPESRRWEMIYLGYSFSDELRNQPVHHPQLRMADRPLGTFGYVVSQQGARALWEYLLQPVRLFKKPVDWAYVDYLQSEVGKGRVFSATPPLVGHGRWEFGTDVGGKSNAFKTWLADSSMARLEEYNRRLAIKAQIETKDE